MLLMIARKMFTKMCFKANKDIVIVLKPSYLFCLINRLLYNQDNDGTK